MKRKEIEGIPDIDLSKIARNGIVNFLNENYDFDTDWTRDEVIELFESINSNFSHNFKNRIWFGKGENSDWDTAIEVFYRIKTPIGELDILGDVLSEGDMLSGELCAEEVAEEFIGLYEEYIKFANEFYPLINKNIIYKYVD